MPRIPRPGAAKKKVPIDWQEVHQRLAAAGSALSREVSPEEQKRILKARALVLARAAGETAARAGDLEVLEFTLADETYGIEMRFVRETCPLRELTPVPCTPPFVLGIINLRGQILSVIDLKKFFGLPEKGLTDLNKVIIVHDGQMEFGILADEILGVRLRASARLQPSLPTLTGVREEYLRGITEERCVVLDGQKLLTDKSLIVHDELGE